MSDVYLLTAPVLLLGIVALLRFVGCQFTPPSPPVAPTTLSATPGSSEVTLNWTENEKDTEGYSYQINRSNDGLPATVVDTVTYVGTPGPNSSTLYSYTDNSGLTNGITYTYTVTLFVYGNNYGTTNAVAVTPTLFTNRPSGSVLDTGNLLATDLIGLYLMNGGAAESMQGMPAQDVNLVDGVTANQNGAAPPTWQAADPSIQFNGGASLNSYLDAGVDALFHDMPTSMITIVAKVFVTAVANGGICEKNDDKPPNSDSGFIFVLTNTGALHVKVELSTQSMVLETNGGVVTAGQWMQLAFTWDGTQYNAVTQTAPSAAAAIFVNQTNQVNNLNAVATHNGTGTLDTTRISNTRSFRIGNAAYDFAGSLNGRIAYMAVYKGRILTTTEMAMLDATLPIKAA
jgi:hypothetical protein